MDGELTWPQEPSLPTLSKLSGILSLQTKMKQQLQGELQKPRLVFCKYSINTSRIDESMGRDDNHDV